MQALYVAFEANSLSPFLETADLVSLSVANKELMAYETQIHTLATSRVAAVASLSTLPLLRKLRISKVYLDDPHLQDLFTVLSRLRRLESLALTHTAFGSLSLDALGHALCHMGDQLWDLDLSCNAIRYEGAVSLATVLPCLPHLRSLSVRNNYLTDYGVGALVDGLVKMPGQLVALDVGQNGMTNVGALDLERALVHHQRLSTLCVAYNMVESLGLQNLLHALAEARRPSDKAPGLRLRLAGCAFGDEGCRLLAQYLQVHGGGMVELDMTDCAFGLPGLRALAEALPRAPRLERLSLGCNFFGHQGVPYLARAIEALPRLAALGMRYAFVGDGGAAELAASLAHVQGLEELDLAGNDVDVRGCRQVAAALARLPGRLRLLNLDDNAIKTPGAEALGHVFERVPRLEKLSLRGNGLCPHGVATVAQRAELALAHLERLDVSGNAVQLSGAKQLASLMGSGQLRELTVTPDAVGDEGLLILKEAQGSGGPRCRLVHSRGF